MVAPGEPCLTVVVPTRDRPEMLERCLASLRAALGPGDELVVVDSASVDPAVRSVAERHRARYHRVDEPGASKARNDGWQVAVHGVVAFVDDDVTVSPQWADALRRAVAAHPDAAFVAGRLEVPPGQEGVERPVAVKNESQAAVLDGDARGALGHSANLAVRRSALERVGGFDEALGAGGRFRACEDGDLFDRLIAAGFPGRYEPSVLAWHDQWRDRKQLLRLDWNYGFGFGARLVKLVRADRRRSRRVAWDFLWVWGVALVPPAVRRGYKFGAASPLMRVAGAVAGAAAAARVPVERGHLRAGGARVSA